MKYNAQLYNGPSNISMAFLFFQNLILTVFNPLIPTYKKSIIFIKFNVPHGFCQALLPSILRWDSLHTLLSVNIEKYYRLSMEIEYDTTIHMVNPIV